MTGGLIETYIHFDLHMTENQSGWVEKVVGEVGGQFRTLFLGMYDLTQPILPAILVIFFMQKYKKYLLMLALHEK